MEENVNGTVSTGDNINMPESTTTTASVSKETKYTEVNMSEIHSKNSDEEALDEKVPDDLEDELIKDKFWDELDEPESFIEDMEIILKKPTSKLMVGGFILYAVADTALMVTPYNKAWQIAKQVGKITLGGTALCEFMGLCDMVNDF